MVDIQSAAAEIRRGIKKDRKKPQGKNILSASATQGGHKNTYSGQQKPNLRCEKKGVKRIRKPAGNSES